MSAPFNPLQYPLCLSMPAQLVSGSDWNAHVPLIRFLAERLRPRAAIQLGGEVALAALREASLALAEPLEGVAEAKLEAAITRVGEGAIELVFLEGPRALAEAKAHAARFSPRAVAVALGVSDDVVAKDASWPLPHFHFPHGSGLALVALGPLAGEALAGTPFGLAEGEARATAALFAALGERVVAEANRQSSDEDAVPRLREALKRERGNLALTAAQLDELRANLDGQRRELESIHGSMGFRLVKQYWAARESMLPPGTRVGALYERSKRGVARLAGVTRDRDSAQLSAPDPAQPWGRPLTEVSRQSVGERVLIIAELSIPQCRRYRVDQKAEMLRGLGYDVTIVSWTDPLSARAALQLHGLAIFYRVPAHADVVSLIDEARRLGVPSFFDVDDLVFDEVEYTKNSNLTKLSEKERKTLLRGVRLYADALTRCDHAIASTRCIAEHMRRFNRGSIYVVENALDEGHLSLAEELDRRPPLATPETVTIGYGSGTRTHDADFAVAADAVLEVLERFPQVRLAIHGYLELPAAFERFKDRVFRIPFLDAVDYQRAVASWQISIAPLETSLFNDAKSNIKFLEASAFRVPTVCSPAAAFSEVVEDGQNGFLARTREEWVSALSKLVTSDSLRSEIGQRAWQTVQERYRPEVVAARQLSAVLSHLSPKETRSSDSLRVLQVNVLFAPQSFGGATIVAEQIAQRLQEDGCEVTVFTGLHGTSMKPHAVARYEAAGLPVIGMQIPSAEKNRSLEYKNHEVIDVFAQTLRAVRPHVVHFHSIQQVSATLAEACSQQGIPYVITLHDAWWLCERQFMVREDGNYCYQQEVDLRVCSKCVPDPAYTARRTHYLRKILDGAALLLTPSEFQRQLYLSNGLAPERVVVNKNGVLLPPLTPSPRPARSKLRFAYLGGRAHHKGYFWLQEIFGGISETNYVLTLTDIQRRLGGSSLHEAEWKLGGQVEIVEPYDQARLDAFFEGVDVLLMPSRWKESFGLAVREALARNVWVITTAAGGVVEDVVEGVNGNVLEIGDTQGFRAAIRALLQEPGRLTGYENPARERVRSYDEQARELKALLRVVARAHPELELEAAEQERSLPASTQRARAL